MFLPVAARAIGSAVTGRRVSQTWRSSGAALSFSLCLLAFEHLIVTTRNLRYSCDRCIFLYRVDSEKGLGCFVESI